MTKDSTHHTSAPPDVPALPDLAAAPLTPETRDHESRAINRSSRRARHLADERLVEAIAEHDKSAFADAYSQHGNEVHALARGVCGAACAEEVTQETFLQLWNNPQHFDVDDGSLRSYLLVQAHRRAVGIVRDDNARVSKEAKQSGRPNAQRPGTEVTVRALVERAGISEFLAALSVDERHPIVLAYFGGHTCREIARLLAVPEGTVRSRIRNGLKRIGEHGGPELNPS